MDSHRYKLSCGATRAASQSELNQTSILGLLPKEPSGSRARGGLATYNLRRFGSDYTSVIEEQGHSGRLMGLSKEFLEGLPTEPAKEPPNEPSSDPSNEVPKEIPKGLLKELTGGKVSPSQTNKTRSLVEVLMRSAGHIGPSKDFPLHASGPQTTRKEPAKTRARAFHSFR